MKNLFIKIGSGKVYTLLALFLLLNVKDTVKNGS